MFIRYGTGLCQGPKARAQKLKKIQLVVSTWIVQSLINWEGSMGSKENLRAQSQIWAQSNSRHLIAIKLLKALLGNISVMSLGLGLNKSFSIQITIPKSKAKKVQISKLSTQWGSEEFSYINVLNDEKASKNRRLHYFLKQIFLKQFF